MSLLKSHGLKISASLLASIASLLLPGGQNLEYEYVLYFTILVTIFYPIISLITPLKYVPRLANQYFPDYHPPLKKTLCDTLLLQPLIANILPIALFYSSVCKCSGMGYVFWYLMLGWPAQIIGLSLYHFILKQRCQGKSTIVIGSLFGIFYMSYLAAFVTMIFTMPQKRGVNFFFGFIHGPIYDHWIAFDRGIFLARMSHLLIGLCILILAVRKFRYASILTVTILLLTSTVTFQLATQYPSVQNGHVPLRKLLNAEAKGNGFTINYDPNHLGTHEDPSSEAAQLYAETVFHLTELRDIFNETPKLIRIYVYPDNETKKIAFGGGSTDVTDVWSPSIHITAQKLPHGTLRHELVHAIASRFGYHGLGFHPNMAFTEGLAVALAPENDTLSLDEGAANILRNKKISDIETLFSPLFWKESESRAYTVAGSLIKFMIDTYGIAAIKELYAGKNIESVLKVSKSQVLSDWQKKLQFAVDPKRLDLYAETIYRAPGILSDTCPHSKVDLKRPRSDGYFVRLRQPLGWDPDRHYYAWRDTIDRANKSVWVDEAKKKVEKALEDKFTLKSNLLSWVKEYESNVVEDYKTLEDVEFMMLLSDVEAFLGQDEKSMNHLKQLLPLSDRIGDNMTRQIATRYYVESLNIKFKNQWRRYLAGYRSELPETTAFREEPWILTYLRLRRMQKQMLKDLGFDNLLKMTPPNDLADTFKVEWFRLLADELNRKLRFDEASEFYKKAANNASPGQSPRLFEHARRMQFYAKHPELVNAANKRVQK